MFNVAKSAFYLLAIMSLTLSGLALAQSPDLESQKQVNIESPKEEVGSALLEVILSEEKEINRYLGLKKFLGTYGEWVTLNANGMKAKIHITSYLLQTGRINEAVALGKNNDAETWLTYEFQGGIASDFMFALDGDHVDYLEMLISDHPSGVEKLFPVSVDGNLISPLALLATSRYMNKPYYDNVVRLLLKSGANPKKEVSIGLSPLIIASSSNNMKFINITQTFVEEQAKDSQSLFSNSPLSVDQLLEMQAIADALIERGVDAHKDFAYQKLFDLWVQMIMKGYNVPADLIYDLLVKKSEFNKQDASSRGLTPLMAATLSELYGGNVEYAKKLIERGFEPKTLIELDGGVKVNLIQLSLQSDNHKMVALYMASGVNFITLPDDDEVFILTQAMDQKAFKSAYILREALVSALER